MELKTIPDSQLIEEYQRRFIREEGEALNGVTESVSHFRGLLSDVESDLEHFAIVYLNQQNQVIHSKVLFTGTLNSSAVYPRELVKDVLKYEAAAVIICHNHPSGNVKPSGSDRTVTTKIKTALSSIDVELLDHLILGNGSIEHFSFAEHHLIK